MPPPKIDKSHGFMQSIIKNQVLRDEYDKERKLMATSKKIGESLQNEELSERTDSRNRTPRRAAKELYVPPKRIRESLKNEELSERTDSTNRTPRRAAKELYTPPHLKKRGVVEQTTELLTQESPKESAEVRQELKRLRRTMSQKNKELKVLFKFEYEDDSGEVKSILVKEDDNAEDLAETFGNQLGLTKTLRKALQKKLHMEIMGCYDS